jgi:hypothetical protein
MPLPASTTAGNSSKFTPVPTASQNCVMNSIEWLPIIKDEAAKIQEKRKHSK